MTTDSADILLVEDNANDEKLALHAFAKQRVTDSVHVVRDGAEALDYLFCTGDYSQRRRENPKLIVLDLKVPLIDGLEVLRRLRNDPHTRVIPVVALTSSDAESDIVESYALGVNSYIVKPVDFDRFNEVARQLRDYWLKLNRQPYIADGGPPKAATTLLTVS